MKKTFIFFIHFLIIKVGAIAQKMDEKPTGIIPDSFKASRKVTFIPITLDKDKKIHSLDDISASMKKLEDQPFETDLEEVKKLKEALEKEKEVLTHSEITKPTVSNINNRIYTVRKMKIIKKLSKSKKKKRPCNCP